MSSIDDVLATIPMDRLAAQLGVDEETAEQAARTALPALFGGMQADAQDPAGAASLQRAVGNHDPGLVEGGADLGQVDTADGSVLGGGGGKGGGFDIGDALGGLLGGGRR